jgi:hypothetical protein
MSASAFHWQGLADDSTEVVVELTAAGWLATVAGVSRAARSRLPEAVRAAGGELLDEPAIARVVAEIRRASRERRRPGHG